MALSLGHMIMTSGAVVYLRDKLGPIRVFCYPYYFESVVSFFREEEGVVVQPVTSREEMVGWPGEQIMDSICMNINMLPGESLDMFHYRYLGVPFEARWMHCPIPRSVESMNLTSVSAPPFIFIHDDPDRGMNVNLDRISKLHEPGFTAIFKPLPGLGSILRWIPWMRAAMEGHYIDSSLMHLRNCFDWPEQKCFFHTYARSYDASANNFRFKGDWTHVY